MIGAILAAVAFNSVVMMVCFLIARARNFYSMVDSVWAFSIPATAALYAFLGEARGVRLGLLLLPPLFWGARLGLHLSARLRSHFPREDGRYIALREDYVKEGRGVERGFFRFFQFQAMSVVILSAPFLLISRDPSEALGLLEIAGAVVWLAGLIGEAFADAQMRRFRHETPGRTCNVGLWRYSRHPNYFFESVIWWGYFLMALPSPSGWAALYCPLLMLFLLLKVTGVPYAEAQSLKSRGDEFRAYQKRTPVFVPWFPKKP
ncbi:MAG: DUF1295 domain-containing protein [Proteobacteria bacterium]|nr:DUF1295 domain-containing protein [Pseudomonadota bacterium]